MHQDPISDLLTRIRNACMANLQRVAVPSSKLKLEVLRILKDEGFISDYSVSDKYHGVIKIYLKYKDGKPVLSNLQRLSKPGRRLYKAVDLIPKALDGYGLTIVSTSKGIMSDRDARKQRVGGEVICQVW
ncbi:MAG: 30S ribosomal protein S8 [Proteobacteria bacterium]|nr:30S ribosomal protein S8 [Pseudomonadota bacterium]